MSQRERPLELRLRLSLLTPTFIRGAGDESEDGGAEFRAASLRGLLRYWFRAVHGHGTEEGPAMEAGPVNKKGPLSFPARTLVEREALLFGSTRWAGLVRVFPIGEMPEVIGHGHALWNNAFGESTQEQPTRGYLWYTARMNQRAWFRPKTSNVRLRILVDLARFRQCGVEGWSERDCLVGLGRALGAWASFSGLGLRSRRAAGSFQVALEESVGDGAALAAVTQPLIDAILPFSECSTVSDLSSRIRSLHVAGCGAGSVSMPGFHTMAPGRFLAGAWSEDARGFQTEIEAVDSLAKAFRKGRRANRSWDAVHAIDAGGPVAEPVPIDNAVFGLPLTYRFTHGNRSKFDVQASLPSSRSAERPNQIQRRGSPLFFTIRKLGDSAREGRFVVVWCAFDSQFLPTGSVLTASRRYLVKHPNFDTVVTLLRNVGFLVKGEGAR